LKHMKNFLIGILTALLIGGWAVSAEEKNAAEISGIRVAGGMVSVLNESGTWEELGTVQGLRAAIAAQDTVNARTAVPNTESTEETEPKEAEPKETAAPAVENQEEIISISTDENGQILINGEATGYRLAKAAVTAEEGKNENPAEPAENGSEDSDAAEHAEEKTEASDSSLKTEEKSEVITAKTKEDTEASQPKETVKETAEPAEEKTGSAESEKQAAVESTEPKEESGSTAVAEPVEKEEKEAAVSDSETAADQVKASEGNAETKEAEPLSKTQDSSESESSPAQEKEALTADQETSSEARTAVADTEDTAESKAAETAVEEKKDSETRTPETVTESADASEAEKASETDGDTLYTVSITYVNEEGETLGTEDLSLKAGTYAVPAYHLPENTTLISDPAITVTEGKQSRILVVHQEETYPVILNFIDSTGKKISSRELKLPAGTYATEIGKHLGIANTILPEDGYIASIPKQITVEKMTNQFDILVKKGNTCGENAEYDKDAKACVCTFAKDLDPYRTACPAFVNQ